MNGWMLFMLLIILVPTGVMVSMIPYFTRKTESFGVSIEAKYYNDPEISAMRRLYSTGTGLASAVVIIAAIVTAWNLDENTVAWALPIFTLLMLAVHAAFYLYFHFRMKKLKVERNLLSPEFQVTVVDTAFYQQKRAYSNLWLVPHVILTALTAWICVFYYDRFPDLLVMQTDFQGNPTRIVEKTQTGVLFPVFIQLFMIALFWMVNYIISSSKQQVDAANPQQSLQQNVIFRRRWSLFMLIVGFLLTVSFGLIPLQMLIGFDMNIVMAVTLSITLITLAGALLIAITTGQGGSRIPAKQGGGTAGGVSRDDDRYWKLGQFYFNPQDPALFLEKRFGIGWTMNFARPLAWTFLLAPFVFVGIILWLS